MAPKVTLLAPVYNEEAVLERFCEVALKAIDPDWEFLLVDDGSTDTTPQILERLQTTDDRVHVLTHGRNRGMGAALVTGFGKAQGEIVVCMDADLSHPTSLIPQLVAGCESADAVYGSRYVPGGGMQGIPWPRVLISRVANFILRAVFGTRVKDLTTGFRAYRTEAVRGLDLTGTGFETQLEITIKLVAAGRKIVEVPLQLTQRAAGDSKMKYMRLIAVYSRMVLRLLRARWLRRTRQTTH